MYIKEVSIENIKSINKLKLTFPAPYSGWHVLLGDNGSGKSSILKAISLCLIGEKQGYALKENFGNWISKGKEKEGASCQLDIVFFNTLPFPEKVSNVPMYDDNSSIMRIDENGDLNQTFSRKATLPQNQYSGAFGPYRRLGNKDTKKLDRLSYKSLESHITLFDNNYNLTSAVKWLMDLKFEQLSREKYGKARGYPGNTDLVHVLSFINDSNLLPKNVKIEEVNHEGVFFVDGNNKNIDTNELSDGYQSMFALTVEILRQIRQYYHFNLTLKKTEEGWIVSAPGVILIDEIDIHLHPKWQAKIGEWFKKTFPQIQFIVTTHSPIICQSAEGATIWKIEHSKSGKPSHQITGQDYKRMVYGSITDAISTDSFGGESIERSEKSNEMLNRLAELNIKSIRGKITKDETEELKTLKSILPSENL